MKKLIIVCVSCVMSVTAHTQNLTEKYLKMVPPVPMDTCNISRNAISNFVSQVTVLSNQLNTEIESLRKTADQKMEGSEEIAKANAMKQMSQQFGLSPEQMQKMQGGKMSAAEKQALANQVLQQQTNMSMGEIQNMSKMSEAGKKAYMEAYGAEMMATGQTAQNQQYASDSKNMNELITQQQALNTKINSTSQKIGNLYASIENDSQLQKSYQNIEKWRNKLMSMSGADGGQGDQMDSLAVLITNEQKKICSIFTPRMHSALNQHMVFMRSVIPDAYQLGQITAQITKLQTGVVIPIENNEAMALGLVQEYLGKLKDAYKFKLYFAEDN